MIKRFGSGQEEPRQSGKGEAIVEHPHLTAMDEHKVEHREVRGAVRLMDEHAPAFTASSRGEMPPVPHDPGANHAVKADDELPPQQPAPSRQAAAGGEGYLRLQMRVEDGEVSVVGASHVPGPLAPAPAMHGGFAYEVTLGSEQLAAGDVPDPGVRRGFVRPDDPSGGHHIVDVSSYEFTARIPGASMSAVKLPDVQVSVYRLDPAQVVQPTRERPLRAHAGQLADEVASLRGIRLESLPHQVRNDIERAIR